MSRTMLLLLIGVIIVIIFGVRAEASGEVLLFHCPDRIRDLMINSCKHLNAALRERSLNRQAHTGLVKREINNATEEEDNFVEFLENETYEDNLKGHRLYNVRRQSYPVGAHIVLSHHSAKILREYDPKYKIEPRSMVYRNSGGRLIKDYSNRHRRNSDRRAIIDRMAGCCLDYTKCMLAFCLSV